MKLDKFITEATDTIVKNGPEIWQKLRKDCKPYLKEYKKTGYVGKKAIWRGSSGIKKEGIMAISPRIDRKPKDMPTYLHQKFDEDFYNRHNWYARSEGVFTTAKMATARTYGNPYLFYPIGKYKYLWTDQTDDLYTFADSENLLNYGDEPWSEYNSDEVHDLWHESYGEGSGSGHWEYQGEEVADYRSDRHEVEDEVRSIEGEDFEDFAIEWIPEVLLDDFIYEKDREEEERQEQEIWDMVKSYTNKDLRGALISNSEIMFKCKAYYIVQPIYEDFLADMMLSGEYQISLPFPPYGTTDPPKYFSYNKKGKAVYKAY